jgi:two-component system, OmpR family, sensor kinase
VGGQGPMSHSWSSWLRRLLSPGLSVPLRLKVMTGVVAVTLIALAALDVGAVIMTRDYLLAQTDNNLHLALTVTEPKLKSLIADGLPAPSPPVRSRAVLFEQGDRRKQRTRTQSQRQAVKFRAQPLVGNYEIAFVPRRGAAVILEAGANIEGGKQFLILQSNVVRSLAQPGLRTTSVGTAGFRVLTAPVQGGWLVVGTSLAQVTQTTDRVEAIVVIGSVAVILLIGAGVFFVMRRGLRPIEAMARQADRLTGGDLSGRVAVQDPGSEVGRLGAALNGMLARIEDSQQQMRRFFGDASHELRTPLASLRANAQLYQQGAVQDAGEVSEVMDRIVLETRRMGRLVDDMLGLARLGEQPCQSEEPVDVTAVVTACAERARIADPRRGWQAQIADGLTVTGDEELLRRAVDNLLTNVIVHTPADTAWAVSASAAGGCVTIEVSDDGPGVPAEHLPHICDRFYRARTLPGACGSGLGLAIAAEIISAHGGTLTATAVSPHGLRIALTLPAGPVPRSASSC